MNVTMVKAGAGDIAELLAWRMEVLGEVFGAQDEAEAARLEDENLRYYQEALANGSHIAVFAQVEGETVGCGGVCLHREMPSPDNVTGTCAYLMNIYTREGFRGAGVGTRIVERLLAEAKETGASKVYLEASDAARGLYGKLGFTRLENYMILTQDGR